MYETEKGPKLKSFDFESFQEKMPSHDKILLQMGFEVFYGTFRIYFDMKKMIYGHVKETSCSVYFMLHF